MYGNARRGRRVGEGGTYNLYKVLVKSGLHSFDHDQIFERMMYSYRSAFDNALYEVP